LELVSVVVGLMVFLFRYTHCGLEVEHERWKW
jgi:hypothetical protein